MNERIQELAEQAGIFRPKEFYQHIDALQLEKFAELIVRECARVYWNIDDGEIHGEYVKALKEHFGVEEK
jgi:hypothetical protein